MVSGDISLADGAQAKAIKGVDSPIRLGAKAQAENIRSVSGDIHLGSRSRVEDDIRSVTGPVAVAEGASIGGSISTLTANVTLQSAFVADSVSTVSGRLVFSGSSNVGSVRFESPDPDETNPEVLRLPVLLVGPRVVVNGPIEADRGATIVASRSSRLGPVSGATVRYVDGDPTSDAVTRPN